jgi:uncharacterized alkaline shock family protein YloU
MKKVNRFLLLLVCAVVIGTGLALVVLVLRPADWQTVCTVMAASRVGGLVAGLLLVALGGLLIFSEAPRRRRDRFLSFRNEGGAVNISTEAIAEYIAKLASAFPSIVRMTPTVEPHRRKVDIVIDVRIKAGPQLHEICEVLQKRVRESMEGGLGIHDVRHVVIRVKEISSEHKTE